MDTLKSGNFLLAELPPKIHAVWSGLKPVKPRVQAGILAYRNWTASWNWYTEISVTKDLWATLLDFDGNVKIKLFIQ